MECKNETVIRYRHHGRDVSVIAKLKGKHREICLCYQCDKFEPGEDYNCPWAKILYGVCCAPKGPMVTPVTECESFQEIPYKSHKK